MYKDRPENEFITCSDLNKFYSSVVAQLVVKGSTHQPFYICEYKSKQYLIKVLFYRKLRSEIPTLPSTKEMANVSDVEIQIADLLNKNILDKNYNDCIIRLYYSAVCDDISKQFDTNCEQLPFDENPGEQVRALLCRYSDDVRYGIMKDKIAFVSYEMCHISFNEYVQNGFNSAIEIAIFKSLLCRLINCLYCISLVYPGYKHYDLHTANVLLIYNTNYSWSHNKLQYMEYPSLDSNLYIPYFGIDVKIIDFGYSAIPEENVISPVVHDTLIMRVHTGHDLLLFFHYIFYYLVNTKGEMNTSAIDILDVLDPTHTYRNYYPKEAIANKINDKFTINGLMKSQLWDEYRTVQSNIYKKFDPVP